MKVLRCLLVVIVLLLNVEAEAKTASEVFDIASKSIVIVIGYDDKGNPSSFGSGVVLPNGDIATNYHVIEKASKILVLYKGNVYPTSAKFTDWERDVCALTAKNFKAPPATLGTTKGLKIGSRVYAIGSPKGLELSLSEGIVASLRQLDGGQYIQTTAPISPGSSGGGLFDEKGQLIGLMTFYLEGGQNLNFAIPVEWLKDLRHLQKPQERKFSQLDYLNRSIVLENEKNWPKLIEWCLRWTENYPDDFIAWSILGNAYSNSQRYDEAMVAVSRAISINNQDNVVWYALGEIYFNCGYYMEALECYRQSLMINQDLSYAWGGIGLSLCKLDRYSEAINPLRWAIEKNPNEVIFWHNLFLTYLKLNMPDEAMATLREAIILEPENYHYWYHLGLLYAGANNTAETIEAFKTSVRINPDFIEGWICLGVAYSHSGNEKEAMAVVKKLRRIAPEEADRLLNEVLPNR